MAMKRCKANMHFYDTDKHKECPYCRNISEDVDNTQAVGETVGIPGNRTETGATRSIGERSRQIPDNERTIGEYDPGDLDGQKTIGVFKTPEGETFEPVVGWLVCVEGPNKGRDYRICAKSGSNIISRAPGKNISIVISDPAISRSEHAEILFDSRENIFYLVRKTSSEVRLRGKLVLASEVLKPYDEVELGTSKFLFVPFCVGDFKW